MKKYNEIQKEINDTRATISHDAQNELKRATENARDVLHAHGVEAYKREKAQTVATLEERATAEAINNERAKIALEILKDNAKQAHFAENIAKICEIWNRYAGKPHGEKTAEKIRAEIETATGAYVRVVNKWDGACIDVTKWAHGCAIREIEYTASERAEHYDDKRGAIDNNNKILEISADVFAVDYCREYIDDVPAHADKIIKAHKELLQAQEEFNQKIDEYNALTRGNVASFSHSYEVKNYIL
jgi:hypothetical protein